MSWTRRKAQKKKKRRKGSKCSFCGSDCRVKVVTGEHFFSHNWGICFKLCDNCKTVHLLTKCERFLDHYDLETMITQIRDGYDLKY